MEHFPQRSPQSKEQTPPKLESPEAIQERTAEILERFDFKTLQDIFKEERTKSGVSGNDSDFFTEPERIRLDLSGTDATRGSLETDGSIVINPLSIQKDFFDEDKGVTNFENDIVSVLIHEETHASGRNAEDRIPKTILSELALSARTRVMPGTVFLGGSGYQYSYAEKGKIQRTRYNFFNEAVTDSIAEEVYDEYTKRTGTKFGGIHTFRQSYLPQRALLEAFVASVAASAETSTDAVWQSVKQGYFSGLNLGDSELGHLYEEFALTEIMERIQNIHSPEDIPALIQLIPVPKEISTESKDKIRNGLAHLGELITAKQKYLESGDPNYRELLKESIEKLQSITTSISDINERLDS